MYSATPSTSRRQEVGILAHDGSGGSFVLRAIRLREFFFRLSGALSIEGAVFRIAEPGYGACHWFERRLDLKPRRFGPGAAVRAQRVRAKKRLHREPWPVPTRRSMQLHRRSTAQQFRG